MSEKNVVWLSQENFEFDMDGLCYHTTTFCLSLRGKRGAGEMAQRSRALIALVEDLGSIPGNHMAADNSL